MSLSESQLTAASLLSMGMTDQEVADQVGVTRRTIGRWKNLEEFNRAIAGSTQRAIESTIEATGDAVAHRLQQLVPKALDVLQEYLSNPEAKGSDRLRACHIIGNWAGLNQQQQPKEDTPAEQNLKDYLQYLAVAKNGNGSNGGNVSTNHQH